MLLITDEKFNAMNWNERLDYCEEYIKHIAEIRDLNYTLSDIFHDNIWGPAIKDDQKNPPPRTLQPLREALNKMHQLTETEKESDDNTRNCKDSTQQPPSLQHKNGAPSAKET